MFFVTIWVGAGLIANDRRANALQLYLSKPLSAAEYVAGKMAILFVFLIFVTWAPAMGLLLVQAIFAGSFTFIRNNAYLLPAITLFSLAQVLLASSTMLALSSLSKSSRFVGVMYAGLMFFTAALFQALRGITGSTVVCLALARRRPRTARRRHLPHPSALRPAAGRGRRSPSSRSSPRPAFILARRVKGVEIVT